MTMTYRSMAMNPGRSLQLLYNESRALLASFAPSLRVIVGRSSILILLETVIHLVPGTQPTARIKQMFQTDVRIVVYV
jgi:hypothetical protein